MKNPSFNFSAPGPDCMSNPQKSLRKSTPNAHSQMAPSSKNVHKDHSAFTDKDDNSNIGLHFMRGLCHVAFVRNIRGFCFWFEH